MLRHRKPKTESKGNTRNKKYCNIKGRAPLMSALTDSTCQRKESVSLEKLHQKVPKLKYKKELKKKKKKHKRENQITKC